MSARTGSRNQSAARQKNCLNIGTVSPATPEKRSEEAIEWKLSVELL